MKFFIEGESRDGEELWLEMREQNGEIQKRRIKERRGEDGVREMDELGESPGKGREGCSLQRGSPGFWTCAEGLESQGFPEALTF